MSPARNTGPILLVSIGAVLILAVVCYLTIDWQGDSPFTVLPAESSTTAAAGERWSRPARPAGGYIGSDACSKCHSDIAALYQSHPMAQATAPMETASPLEDYQAAAAFTAGGRLYRAERTAEGVFHHESLTAADGTLVYDQAVPIHYGIGSGRRGRSFATQRDALLFMSPLTWYSEGTRWDLSPGYQAGRHRRFDRRVVEGCIHCHAGQTAFDEQRRNSYHQPAILEGGISCERCHGPGERHAAYHRSPQMSSGPDPIVNPAALESDLRESVCYQCHLQGEGRILRYGREETDFRPGQRLDDIWTVFVRGSRVDADGSARAVSHVEQMQSSVCFSKSDGKFGCISCHDPHSVPKAEDRQAFYTAKCLACHQERGCSVPPQEREQSSQGNSCIACHMPRLSANDVPHTSQTDHRVLRKPQAAAAPPQGPLVVFNHGAKRLTPLELDRAQGLMGAQLSLQYANPAIAARIEPLLSSALAVAPDDVLILEALARVANMQSQFSEAAARWEQILAIQPRHEVALAELAKVRHDQGRIDDAVTLLERFFAINQWDADSYGRYAQMLGQRGNFTGAVQAAERSLELDPTQVQVHEWLAEVHDRLNQPDRASRHRQIARELNKQDQSPASE